MESNDLHSYVPIFNTVLVLVFISLTRQTMMTNFPFKMHGVMNVMTSCLKRENGMTVQKDLLKSWQFAKDA